MADRLFHLTVQEYRLDPVEGEKYLRFTGIGDLSTFDTVVRDSADIARAGQITAANLSSLYRENQHVGTK